MGDCCIEGCQLSLLLLHSGAIEAGIIHGHQLALDQRHVRHGCYGARPQLALILQHAQTAPINLVLPPHISSASMTPQKVRQDSSIMAECLSRRGMQRRLTTHLCFPIGGHQEGHCRTRHGSGEKAKEHSSWHTIKAFTHVKSSCQAGVASHLSSDSWVTRVTSVSKPLRLGFHSCSSFSCGSAAIVSSVQPPCHNPTMIVCHAWSVDWAYCHTAQAVSAVHASHPSGALAVVC